MLVLKLLPLFAAVAVAQGGDILVWEEIQINSTERFRGLSSISAATAWISGTSGSVFRTTDYGLSWRNVGPELAAEESDLEFRDVQAFSADKAVVLSIGQGNRSRIYATEDGGLSWNTTFFNMEQSAFYNCLAFEDGMSGFAVSDPVDGYFRLAQTTDGGASWDVVTPQKMPAALDGEFGFAASGTCISTMAGRWYLASGGVDPGRIFHSSDGNSWDVSSSTIAGGDSAGVFSVEFHNRTHGIAVGGNYEDPENNASVSSWTEDGGITWHPSEAPTGGYRSGVTWIPGHPALDPGDAIAVGPSGSDVTYDGGKTWYRFRGGPFDSVECVQGYDEFFEWQCWASGPNGTVGRLFFDQR